MSIDPSKKIALITPLQGPSVNDSGIKQFVSLNFNSSILGFAKICMVGVSIGILALGTIILLAVHQKIGGCHALISLGDPGGMEVMAIGAVILMGLVGYCREVVRHYYKLSKAFKTSAEFIFKCMEQEQCEYSVYRSQKAPGRFFTWVNEKHTLGYLFVMQGSLQRAWLYYDNSENKDFDENCLPPLAKTLKSDVLNLMDKDLMITPLLHENLPDLSLFEEQFHSLLNKSFNGVIPLYHADLGI